MKKRNIFNAIIVIVFAFLLLFYVQNSESIAFQDIDETENSETTDVISFVDPVIEAATREELEMPTGDITKDMVLEITNLFIYVDSTGEIYGYESIESLEDLKWFLNLTELNAANCGISDISVLSALTNLDYLNLSNNQISDISALANLENLTYINLESNQITDLLPIAHLADQLYMPNFYNNPIPEENMNAFFYPIEENHVVTTLHKSISKDMPEFTFTIFSYFDEEDDEYQVYKLEITDNELFQSISIPELTIFGQTHITEYDNLDTMGLVFEDLNFDGYLDLRLFDNYNGNYRKEWLYFVWNPETYQFQYDKVLRSISLPVFDAENQLIYGMERGSAIDHYYSTYKYINNELTLIEYVSHELVWHLQTAEEIETILSQASIEPCKTEDTNYLPLHETISKYNETTGELDIVVDDYIIYLSKDDGYYGDELLRINVSSEIGQIIAEFDN